MSELGDNARPPSARIHERLGNNAAVASDLPCAGRMMDT
jgi:hypothetical protein